MNDTPANPTREPQNAALPGLHLTRFAPDDAAPVAELRVKLDADGAVCGFHFVSLTPDNAPAARAAYQIGVASVPGAGWPVVGNDPTTQLADLRRQLLSEIPAVTSVESEHLCRTHRPGREREEFMLWAWRPKSTLLAMGEGETPEAAAADLRKELAEAEQNAIAADEGVRA